MKQYKKLDSIEKMPDKTNALMEYLKSLSERQKLKKSVKEYIDTTLLILKSSLNEYYSTVKKYYTAGNHGRNLHFPMEAEGFRKKLLQGLADVGKMSSVIGKDNILFRVQNGNFDGSGTDINSHRIFHIACFTHKMTNLLFQYAFDACGYKCVYVVALYRHKPNI